MVQGGTKKIPGGGSCPPPPPPNFPPLIPGQKKFFGPKAEYLLQLFCNFSIVVKLIQRQKRIDKVVIVGGNNNVGG